MSNAKQIKIGAILSYLSIAINIIAGLLYTPWMIDKIGASDYGIYTLSHTLITLFLIDFGLSSAVARYISKFRAEGKEEQIEGFLGAIYKLYLIIDAAILLALVVVYLFIDTIYVKLTPAELEKFKIVYIISAAFSVLNFPFVTLNGILTSCEKFIQQKTADIIYRVLLVGLTVAALLCGMGLYALVTANAVAGLSIVVYKLLCIRKYTNIKVSFRAGEKGIYKDIFSFSVWVTITTLAQRLIFNITPSILGMVVNSAAIAVFGVVIQVEGYTYTITNAINGMFLPKVSKIYAAGNPDDGVTKLLIKVGKFQYILNGLIVLEFAVIGKSFIRLWVGPEFTAAYYGILLVVIPGLFFNSLQIANTAMIVQNKVRLQAQIGVVVGITNVVLSFVFSSLWGMIGACASIFVAYMIRALATNVVSYRKLKINTLLFAKECYLKMSVPLAISLALSVGLSRLVPDGTWLVFVGKAAVIAVIYGLAVLLLGTDRADKQAIRLRMKSFCNKQRNKE